MFWRTWKNTFPQKKLKGDVKALLEIRNQKLCIDGNTIGDEEKLLAIFEKAIKYDELMETTFKGGDA